MPDNILFRPLTNKPRKMADMIADEMDPANSNKADRGVVKPFMAGAMQGLGDVASDFTSPFSLGTMLMGGAEAGPLTRAFKSIRGLGRIGSMASGEAGADVAAINRSLAESKDILDSVSNTKRAEDTLARGAETAKRGLSKAERYSETYPKTPSARATEAARLKAERRYRRTGEGHENF